MRHCPDLGPILVLMTDDPRVAKARPVRKRFLRLLDALEQVRARYAVCGAVALGAHGVRRFTEDIDLLLAPADVEPLLAALRRSFREVGRQPKKGAPYQIKLRSIRTHRTNVDIDLLVPVDAAEEWALASAQRGKLFGRRVDVVSPEALVVLKLRAHLSDPESPSGLKHLADAVALVQATPLDRRTLQRFVSSDQPLAAALMRAFAAPTPQGRIRR